VYGEPSIPETKAHDTWIHSEGIESTVTDMDLRPHAVSGRGEVSLTCSSTVRHACRVLVVGIHWGRHGFAASEIAGQDSPTHQCDTLAEKTTA
jgi:hypothetical protein